jgi:ABC-type Zn uptake system ZnuABC Zn-binding protein ZnuA
MRHLSTSIRRAARFARRITALTALGLPLSIGALPAGSGLLVTQAIAAAKPLVVITTTEDLAAIAREVGGDLVKVTSLARGFQDPHFVDAKPSYMVALKNADLYVEIGRELEVGWAPGLLSGARNPKILAGAPGFIDASAQVQVIEVPTSVSRSQGDVHPFGNPHYWLDPANGVGIARAIRDGLKRASPANAAQFDQRCTDFENRLALAIVRWKQQAKSMGLQGMKVVTYHRSWSYFARAFGLDVVDFVEPRPGISPSPNHLRELVELMKSQGVKLLVMEPFFDPRLPQKIAKDTGAPLAIVPTSVGAEAGITTYFDLFDYQLKVISQALKK